MDYEDLFSHLTHLSSSLLNKNTLMTLKDYEVMRPPCIFSH
uniref:Uncharacterized protein n=1 Tax=Rhizophora mucronata TaxID=61149 RepID=A0A2P2Q0P2_RHIMU